MEQIFPLVAKYGGVVVGLLSDEDGIPETAEGRIAVGKKIIDTAATYGIGPEDIILDGLCMTVSSDSQGAIVTLETLRKIRDELGGKSVLGVSNISFGLPQRDHQRCFFTMAMESGFYAAIINPNSEAMMRAYYSFNALMNLILSAVNISAFTVVRRQVWDRPLEKVEMVREVPGAAGNGVQGARSREMPLKEALKKWQKA